MTEPTLATPTLTGLVRRWSVDWLNAQHPEMCEQILAPSYTLLIGGYLLGPRETYVPATMAQLERFPGLVVTTHQLVTSGNRLALVFSEHGASARLDGKTAVWSGIALFRWNGVALTQCFAEEDYYGRRRQFATAEPDLVDRPAIAPWDQVPQPADAAAEAVVRDWLAGPRLRSVPVVCDDEGAGQPSHDLLEVTDCRVDEVFSAGDQVAFHVGQTGAYRGGLDALDDCIGQTTTLEVAGVVTVRGGQIVGGRVIRDRLGMARSLRENHTP